MAYKTGSTAKICNTEKIYKPTTANELREIFLEALAADTPLSVYRSYCREGCPVDLSGMDSILEIDSANLVATVEPGVRLGTLAAALANQQLRFVPADTPFFHSKTIGEFYYEGCSNISSTKYGFAKHFLMGSEVMLPTGEVLKTGGKTVKNVTGYDFTRFINSPYTDFGVTVKFLLKLLPLPEKRENITFRFDHLQNVFAFIEEMRLYKINPAYLLWADGQALRIVNNSASTGHYVTLEVDGISEEVDEQVQMLSSILKKHQGLLAAAESDDFIRNAFAQLYMPQKGYALIDELKFNFQTQKQFADDFQTAAMQHHAEAGLFGQLADGKVNIMFANMGNTEHSFIKEIQHRAVQLGGFSSGKYAHCFGLPRSGPMDALYLRLKQMFDPQIILNRKEVGSHG